LSIPLLQKSQKRLLQKDHTTWIWLKVSFEDLSQGKIKHCKTTISQKSNFMKLQKEQLETILPMC